ncbi:MAG: SipW-dependent-type signal peptide-containing protein [Clostridia bacterium]|nr:SipW-dependent-type signal peptide-containing protein [Clostridia bacterium]
MKKIKSTKRALLISALALLLCVSMLIGSTFAWFTDSVTSAGNIIKSGTLDVDLLDAQGKSLAGEVLEFVDQDDNDLWEPGCTYKLEEVYVANKGSLALKYEIVISGIEGDAKLLEAIEWTVEGAALKGSLEPNTKTDALQITGHMKEDAGNEYQGLTMEGISITVQATQYTAESDSFGPDYDKNAPLLVWEGTIDTSWYNADATSYELSSPAKLAGLAKLVNDGNTFAGKSIKLAADMDLNNIAWTAIGNGTANFNGKFYGNGYTIYNLTVSGTKGVGLFGFAGNAAHIEGVHIVGANVTGVNSVGAVLGYGYLAADCLKNCIVEDALVYAAAGDSKEDGDKVGAVAGWTSNGNIIGNKAINCEIYGCRDMGGIVGYVNGENRAVEVSGNTVENVTVSVIEADGYVKVLGSNINDIVGRTGNRVTVKSNSGNITKNEGVAVATGNEDLKNAAAAGGEVLVLSGNYTFPGASIAEDTTLICAPGTVFKGNSKANINGATVIGATFSNPSGSAVDQTINGTFKDCVFDGSNGLRWCYAGETAVFENCVFTGDVYGVHFDGGANDVLFKNCTFSGFNTFGGAITKLTLDGCTFVSNGRSGYNGVNLWGNTEMKNCTFVFDGSVNYEWVDLCTGGISATFTGCVVTDGTNETPIVNVVGNYGDGNTIVIDGETVDIPNMN